MWDSEHTMLSRVASIEVSNTEVIQMDLHDSHVRAWLTWRLSFVFDQERDIYLSAKNEHIVKTLYGIECD